MKELTYLAFGAGVQSTALLLMSEKGLYGCPRADVAIFADTQGEPQAVYEHLLKVQDICTIPIEIVTRGNLGQCLIDRAQGRVTRASSIPAFATGKNGKGAPLRRNCTRDYKLAPIYRRVRELMGLKKYQRAPEGLSVTCMMGISVDEAARIKPGIAPWITNTFPLVDANLTRADCLRIVAEHNWPTPTRSACIFCPYHDDAYWVWLRETWPEEFAKAVAFDEEVRDLSKAGVKTPVFLHRSLVALKDVVFKPKSKGEGWDPFTAECEGMCGV